MIWKGLDFFNDIVFMFCYLVLWDFDVVVYEIFFFEILCVLGKVIGI